MKPLNEMTKRELLTWAEANNILLSSATRLPRAGLERVIRRMMQEGNRDENA